ncbi:MAG: hypothetical protein KY410_01440, partial [Proteobacteria bacterium]|nr:hypothetical protein [Pseudomonadota bacterium]
RRVGTIRVLTPVTAEGADDTSRNREYVGQASLYTPNGALPLNFELEATTLAQAVGKFPEAANKAVEETMRQLQEMRREQASSLVVPGQGGMGGPGTGSKGPGGTGMGGGGGFQIP